MTTRIDTVICPQCRKSREVKGNTAPTYERICRSCSSKQKARRKTGIVLAGSRPPLEPAPLQASGQAPCRKGKAHWWIVPNGPGSEYCNNGCGQKMAPERWADIPKGPHGVLEKHAVLPAWGLKPTMEVNYWG